VGNAGCSNVKLQLRLNRFEAFKLSLAAQEVLERDRHSLAIQIAVEIKQVCFQQRMISVFKKRWSSTKVDSAHMR
jgi:hypothetical protein